MEGGTAGIDKAAARAPSTYGTTGCTLATSILSETVGKEFTFDKVMESLSSLPSLGGQLHHFIASKTLERLFGFEPVLPCKTLLPEMGEERKLLLGGVGKKRKEFGDKASGANSQTGDSADKQRCAQKPRANKGDVQAQSNFPKAKRHKKPRRARGTFPEAGKKQEGQQDARIVLVESIKETRLASQELLELCWERLHQGDWKNVSQGWRVMYGWAAVLSALHSFFVSRTFKEALSTLDIALLMCGSCNLVLYSCLNTFIASAQKHIDSVPLEKMSEGEQDSLHKLNSGTAAPKSRQSTVLLDTSKTIGIVPEIPEERAIPRKRVPSIECFLVDHMGKHNPVVLTGMMEHWPAAQKKGPRYWGNVEYLNSVAGSRTVPVEIGNNYLSEKWSQELMPFRDFIAKYIAAEQDVSSSDAIGYLAQTQLFEQIPELAKDFVVPDFCAFGDDDNAIVNAWFGPGGTVSPLHFDPYHNLLCQVVGRKYIRLYGQSESEKLYPHETRMLFNTSQVDVEAPDKSKFPLFPGAEFVEVVLREGEMLYIPPKMWHYVRSLSTSFSISFWWH